MSTFNFTINEFEGPLDLLLHLIRSNKMDILDMDVETITKEYLDYIKEYSEQNVDIQSEYLVMAAELIHLKSKMLLHQDDDEAEDEEYEINSEEDLKNKLLEYEKMKQVTNEFSLLEDKRSEFFTKLPSSLEEYKNPNNIIEGDTSLEDLINAFNSFLKRQEYNKPLNTKITKKEYSIKDRENDIRKVLNKCKICDFTSLFDIITKPYVIVTFLSVLEMSKNKEISIKQDKNFGNITIEMM